MSEQCARDFDRFIEKSGDSVVAGAISALERLKSKLNRIFYSPYRRGLRIRQTRDEDMIIHSADGKHSFRVIWRLASGELSDSDEIRLTRFQHVSMKYDR